MELAQTLGKIPLQLVPQLCDHGQAAHLLNEDDCMSLISKTTQFNNILEGGGGNISSLNYSSLVASGMIFPGCRNVYVIF